MKSKDRDLRKKEAIDEETEDPVRKLLKKTRKSKKKPWLILYYESKKMMWWRSKRKSGWRVWSRYTTEQGAKMALRSQVLKAESFSKCFPNSKSTWWTRNWRIEFHG